jgi:hypothetical protein
MSTPDEATEPEPEPEPEAVVRASGFMRNSKPETSLEPWEPGSCVVYLLPILIGSISKRVFSLSFTHSDDVSRGQRVFSARFRWR